MPYFDERRNTILKLIESDNFVSFTKLFQLIPVSQMTIRRDVRKLEQAGLVIQVAGGVQAAKRLHIEPSHQVKEGLCSKEKRRIGAQAAKHITQNACIYLDAGTTSLALCEFICDRDDLTVVSNDLAVLHFLSQSSRNTIIMTGGLIRSENLSAVGHLAASTLNKLAIDLAFLSASSFDARGITTPDPDKVPVKEAAAAAANRRILICDSSKYAQFATYLAVPLDRINTIITDNKLSEFGRQSLLKTGIELELV